MVSTSLHLKLVYLFMHPFFKYLSIVLCYKFVDLIIYILLFRRYVSEGNIVLITPPHLSGGQHRHNLFLFPIFPSLFLPVFSIFSSSFSLYFLCFSLMAKLQNQKPMMATKVT